MEALIAIIGVVALIVGLVVYGVFSWGYVCFKFWWWFILPIFPDLPHLNFWQCVGIMFFITLFKNQTPTSDSSKKEKGDYSNLFGVLLAPWLLLLVAYFFH